MSAEYQPQQEQDLHGVSGLQRPDADFVVIGLDKRVQSALGFASDLAEDMEARVSGNRSAVESQKTRIAEAGTMAEQQAETARGIVAGYAAGRAETQSMIDHYNADMRKFDTAAEAIQGKLAAKFEERQGVLADIKGHVEGSQSDRGELGDRLQAMLDQTHSLASELESTGRANLETQRDKAECDREIRESKNRLYNLRRLGETLETLGFRQKADQARDEWAQSKLEEYQQSSAFIEQTQGVYDENGILDSYREQCNIVFSIEVSDGNPEDKTYKELRQELDSRLAELDYDPEEVAALGYDPEAGYASQAGRLEGLLRDIKGNIQREVAACGSLQAKTENLDDNLRGLMRKNEKIIRNFKRLASDDNVQLVKRSEQLTNEEEALWQQLERINQEAGALLAEADRLEPPRFEAVVTAESAGHKLQQVLAEKHGVSSPAGEAAIDQAAGNAKFIAGIKHGNIPDEMLDQMPTKRLLGYVGGKLNAELSAGKQPDLEGASDQAIGSLAVAALNAASERGLLEELLTTEYLAEFIASKSPEGVAKQLTVLASLQAGLELDDAGRVSTVSMEREWGEIVDTFRTQLRDRQAVSSPIESSDVDVEAAQSEPAWFRQGTR